MEPWRFLILSISLIVAACSANRCLMLIGYTNAIDYDYAITGGTFYPDISAAELLYDGHESAQASIVLAGHMITDHVDLEPYLIGTVTNFGAMAMRNISGLRQGTRIRVTDGFGLDVETKVVAGNTGSFDAYIILPENTGTTGPLTLKISIYYNNVNGALVDQSGTIMIGEIWLGQTASFPIGLNFQQTYLNNSKIRYSAGGQQWPLLKSIVRQISVKLVPQNFRDALNNTATVAGIDVHTLICRMAASPTLFIAPFYSIAFNGSPSRANPLLSDQTLADTSFLGAMSSPPQFSGQDIFFNVAFQFSETL